MHDKKMSEDVKGRIRTTCGMSKLLVKEKLFQFDQLVADYEVRAFIIVNINIFNIQLYFSQAQNGEENNATLSSSGTKLVKLDDLKSFFELISVQVCELDTMYDDLRRLRNHGWNDVPVRLYFQYSFIPPLTQTKEKRTLFFGMFFLDKDVVKYTF